MLSLTLSLMSSWPLIQKLQFVVAVAGAVAHPLFCLCLDELSFACSSAGGRGGALHCRRTCFYQGVPCSNSIHTRNTPLMSPSLLVPTVPTNHPSGFVHTTHQTCRPQADKPRVLNTPGSTTSASAACRQRRIRGETWHRPAGAPGTTTRRKTAPPPTTPTTTATKLPPPLFPLLLRRPRVPHAQG